MNDRTVLGVVLTALVLGGFLFVFEGAAVRRDRESREADEVFPGLRADNLSEIGFNSGKTRLVLQRDGDGRWTISEPVKDRVDALQVETLVATLVDLRMAARPIEARGGRQIALGDFGLADSAEKLVVKYGQGDQARTVTLSLGSPVVSLAAGGLGRVHAQLNDQRDRVLIVSDRIRALVAAVGRDPHFYRSRLFFDAESIRDFDQLKFFGVSDDKKRWIQCEIDSVPSELGRPYRAELRGYDSTLVEKLRERGIVRPDPNKHAARDRADRAKVDALLALLSDLRIEMFVDDPKQTKGLFADGDLAPTNSDDPARLAEFGLSERDLRCSVAFVAKTDTGFVDPSGRRLQAEIALGSLIVSARQVPGRPDLVYAKREGQASIFAVRADFLNKLPLSLTELRDPRLLPDTVASVSGLKLIRGGAPVIAMTAGEGAAVGRWTVADSKAPADAELINGLLQYLQEARAAELADWVGDAKANPGSVFPSEARLELSVEYRADEPSSAKPAKAGRAGKSAKPTKPSEPRRGTLTVLVGAFPEPSANAGAGTPPTNKPRLLPIALAWSEEGSPGERRERTVRMADADRLELLRKNRMDFYARTVTVAFAEQIKSMKLERPDGVYQIENRGQDFQPDWWVTAPYTARADAAVSNWPTQFGQLTEATILRVASDRTEAGPAYGLDKPTYRLTLTVRPPNAAPDSDGRPKTETHVLALARKAPVKAADVGPLPEPKDQPDDKKPDDKKPDDKKPDDKKPDDKKPAAGGAAAQAEATASAGVAPPPPMPAAAPIEPERWYLRIGEGALIYEVSATAAAALAGELRNRKVADFGPDERIAEISVTGPTGSHTLTRTEVDVPAPAGSPPGTPATKQSVFKLRIGDGPTVEIRDRRPDAERLFTLFSGFPGERDTLMVQEFLVQSATPDQLAGWELDKPTFTVRVTGQADTRGPTGPAPRPVVKTWELGREIDWANQKVRPMRRVGDGTVFVISSADLKVLLRPAAEFLLPPEVKPVAPAMGLPKLGT